MLLTKPDAASGEEAQWVAQKYIENPLLIARQVLLYSESKYFCTRKASTFVLDSHSKYF